MQRLVAAPIVLIAVALASGVAHAQLGGSLPEIRGAPFKLSADSVEYESARNIYIAKGSVRIEQGRVRLTADWVSFSTATRRGAASGDVVYSDGVNTARTSFIEFDVDTLRGVMFDARIDAASDQFRVEGARIEKTGDATFVIDDGVFTTCDCPDEDHREPWHIEASETELEVGGYGTTRNATFNVFGVPIFYLPWMIFPIKTDRETGLLLPQPGHSSRRGYEISLPFFWAARENLGVTVTEHWYSKPGFKTDLGIDWLPGEESSSSLFGSYIHDDRIDPNTARQPFGRDRWAAKGEQDWSLPGGWRFRSKFAFMSDNAHPNDYDDLDEYVHNRFLESTAFAANSFGAAGQFPVVGSTAFADDIQSPDDSDRDKFLHQRLPNLEFSMLPANLGWLSALVPSFDFEYTNFQWREAPTNKEPTAAVVGDHLFLDTGVDALSDSRERGPRGLVRCDGNLDGMVDDPCADLNQDNFGLPGGTEGNGRFNEGEPLGDRGSRLVLRPRIGAPFRIADAVEVFPEVAWYQTLYDTRYQDFEERGLFTARLDLRTRLSRSLGKGMTHFFEPRIGYAFVSDVGQKSNPLLVPQTALPQRRIRQFDLDNVVLDPSDRIDEFNGITFGFGNRIFGRAPLGDTARLLADVDFSWQFDIDEGDSDLMFLEGRVYPTAISTFRFITGFDPDHGRLEEGLADLTLELYGGHALTLGYRYLRRAPKVFEAFPYEKDRFKRYNSDLERVSQGNLGARIAITDRLVLRYSIAYSFERNLMLSNGGGFEYVSGCRCWEIGITVRDGRSRGTEVSVQYRLTGLGQPRHSSRRSLDELMFVPGLLDAI